eukprot:TRINITY_DN26467_c0_g1_i1.p1 TRINITY_DN26467_c0_g1~~TRINITY_DN26467_c0_g1_i1.p1  ORF type:complete len:389 (-),score=76.54 TRINITY_DN26467_c0_g1_i1:241-1407(-)
MVLETGVAIKALQNVVDLETRDMPLVKGSRRDTNSTADTEAPDGGSKDLVDQTKVDWMRRFAAGLPDDSGLTTGTTEVSPVAGTEVDELGQSNTENTPWARLVTGETDEDGLWMGTQGQPPAAGLAAVPASDAALAMVPTGEWVNTTTVMMCNLSNKYTQMSLMEEINAAGFYGFYDFFYLPLDPETKANRGYAFINFLNPGLAWKFKIRFEGAQMDHANSGKCITVMTAAIQGFEANYAHYAGSRVSRGDIEARPLFLRETPKLPDEDGPPRRRRGGGRRSLIDMVNQRRAATDQTRPQQQQQPQMLMAPVDASKGGNLAGGNHSAAHPFYMQPLLMFPTATPTFTAAMPVPKDTSGQQVINFCPFCGDRAGSGYKFCRNCGSPLMT